MSSLAAERPAPVVTSAVIAERTTLKKSESSALAERWRSAFDRTYIPFEAYPDPAVGERFESRATRYTVDDLVLLECTSGRSHGRRGPREIAATDGDYVGVLVLQRGAIGVTIDDHEVLILPGQLAAWDGAWLSSFRVVSPLFKRTLMVPRERIRAVFPRFEAALRRGIDPDAPAARLLGGYLETLADVQPTLCEAERSAAAAAAVELFAAALRSALPAYSARGHEALHEQVRRYIERHLPDPRLGPATIAKEHAVSVRTLHESFEPTGESVGRLIRRRRLERCHEDLSSSAAESVSTTALRWGFRDMAHFSRVFRAQYGYPPRDLLGASHAA